MQTVRQADVARMSGLGGKRSFPDTDHWDGVDAQISNFDDLKHDLAVGISDFKMGRITPAQLDRGRSVHLFQCQDVHRFICGHVPNLNGLRQIVVARTRRVDADCSG
jgi:hypothetical protein